jgi:hypothetical protein
MTTSANIHPTDLGCGFTNSDSNWPYACVITNMQRRGALSGMEFIDAVRGLSDATLAHIPIFLYCARFFFFSFFRFDSMFFLCELEQYGCNDWREAQACM